MVVAHNRLCLGFTDPEANTIQLGHSLKIQWFTFLNLGYV